MGLGLSGLAVPRGGYRRRQSRGCRRVVVGIPARARRNDGSRSRGVGRVGGSQRRDDVGLGRQLSDCDKVAPHTQ